MLILGIESSAKAASAALCRDGELIAQYYQCAGLTHSRTLLPMAEELLHGTDTALGDLDGVAVAVGPGSFTGVRIGVAAVKGLCFGAEKPAAGVSTLEAMAWNGLAAAPGEIVCCCMDARRGQVYNALFEISDGAPARLVPDRAVTLEELAAELLGYGRAVFLTGDGAQLALGALSAAGLSCRLAPGPLLMQSAWGVCMAARGLEMQSAEKLLPVYLRLSQAERERQERLENTK
ncbi:MAG TPA: tRNA (adenosine(37)-N6)-threonylcarbamoyltransferase complex dimerization subunit type 1 TsaB [Candidatus Scatomorpha intestinavium]|uniref:tRNA (Adenosine(37)-N6)-threonylcarbamoyltransferase complex dimerization subunit type 1 TsaB n=1 Tax=Candidatus Scatomorpha intestinavium TaxID=2840922 RepID=A0A9D1CT15_9FIRM|nr:tRNA (adenosine(37)-N6)-threonylcarbamoyltransferase complex dimerization subunit type 1 TsaB [Candidatus Scatomorpha intestinavium]